MSKRAFSAILLLLILISVFLPACGQEENAADRDRADRGVLTVEKQKELMNKVKVMPEWERNEWENLDETGYFTGEEFVPDAETAIELGTVLLRRFQKSGFFSGYALQRVEYQDEPAIWVISCWRDADAEESGAKVCFAMRRDNAQVVCIWLGEEGTEAKPGEGAAERNRLTDENKAALLQNVRKLPESERNCWERIDDSRRFTEPCVPDAETAMFYGYALLQRFQREGYFPREVPQLIMYQEDPLIWIVSCWEDVGPDVLCADECFVISASDAQVIAFYPEGG